MYVTPGPTGGSTASTPSPQMFDLTTPGATRPANASILFPNVGYKQQLATAVFAGETTGGWQQVLFTTPVPITAGTVYVASYFARRGRYAHDEGYFDAAYDNAPLHALPNGSGGNGVYHYGTSAFPTDTWMATNYWVDVVFDTHP